jgi:hypothetical protein
MASRGARWKQGLFPIDDGLIEKLLDDCHADAQGCNSDEESESTSEPEDAGDDCLLWYLEQNLSDSDTADAETDPDAALEALAGDDAFAVNMRVLNDYLERRVSSETEPIVRTLH